jgi:hypothetical protein
VVKLKIAHGFCAKRSAKQNVTMPISKDNEPLAILGIFWAARNGTLPVISEEWNGGGHIYLSGICFFHYCENLCMLQLQQDFCLI